ncbi:MAG: hypothetical protein K0R28_3391, partial [Paenibacillus sp.]|nr:hypothetical protein [Paenibacillus sp.]
QFDILHASRAGQCEMGNVTGTDQVDQVPVNSRSDDMTAEGHENLAALILGLFQSVDEIVELRVVPPLRERRLAGDEGETRTGRGRLAVGG